MSHVLKSNTTEHGEAKQVELLVDLELTLEVQPVFPDSDPFCFSRMNRDPPYLANQVDFPLEDFSVFFSS